MDSSMYEEEDIEAAAAATLMPEVGPMQQEEDAAVEPMQQQEDAAAGVEPEEAEPTFDDSHEHDDAEAFAVNVPVEDAPEAPADEEELQTGEAAADQDDENSEEAQQQQPEEGGEEDSEDIDEEPPPQKPHRALSAWGLFLAKKFNGAISNKAGEEWRSLSEEDRTEYTEGAAVEKQRFDEEKMVYQLAYEEWSKTHPKAAAKLAASGGLKTQNGNGQPLEPSVPYLPLSKVRRMPSSPLLCSTLLCSPPLLTSYLTSPLLPMRRSPPRCVAWRASPAPRPSPRRACSPLSRYCTGVEPLTCLPCCCTVWLGCRAAPSTSANAPRLIPVCHRRRRR